MIPERSFIDQAADLVGNLEKDGYTNTEIAQISEAMMYLAQLRDMDETTAWLNSRKGVN